MLVVTGFGEFDLQKTVFENHGCFSGMFPWMFPSYRIPHLDCVDSCSGLDTVCMMCPILKQYCSC